jgi:hypothetical protein
MKKNKEKNSIGRKKLMKKKKKIELIGLIL